MKELDPLGSEVSPDELRALDEELRAIRYEERPSFDPELRAELSSTWSAGFPRGIGGRGRSLLAAGIALILLGGVAVPSARASLVRILGRVLAEAPATPATLTPVPARPDGGAEAPGAASELPPRVEDADGGDGSTPPAIDRSAREEDAMVPLTIVAPEMLDRSDAESLLQEAYPEDLQTAGVGGSVLLRLWVDEGGSAGAVRLARSSGNGALDRAALRVAPRFRFVPGLQDGRPFGTWIDFPVLFEPEPTPRVGEAGTLPPVVDPLSLPTVPRAEWWHLREPLAPMDFPPVARVGEAEVAARGWAARRLGPVVTEVRPSVDTAELYAVLAGEAPAGVALSEWRASLGSAFGRAMEEGRANPASMLAFGRIRKRQGLRVEARALFEHGLRLALESDAMASSWAVAELHYERGMLVRERWLRSDGVGRVHAAAFAQGRCAAAAPVRDTDAGTASVERVVAWNYLCPSEMEGLFERGFYEVGGGSVADLSLMMASFRTAIETFPAHSRAHVALLSVLAQKERWDDVLHGARRFARVSEGDPDAFLFAALALHRLGRTAEAERRFGEALARMPALDADALVDVSIFLPESEGAPYRRLPSEERRLFEHDFWQERDRSPETAVNERRTEHLARMAYARLRFGGSFGDAAEVWVRFGRPTDIHIVDEGTGRLTEFWNYGSGPDLTFVRWVSAERADLTPEGRAYFDDLGKIIPPQ